MKILNKIVLFIYAIFVIVTSFIVMVLPFDIGNILAIEETVGFIRYMRGNFVYTLIGGAILVFSLVHLLSLFRDNETINEGAYLVLRNEFGEVLIYQDTIVGLVNNVAYKFTGIKNIKTKVSFFEGSINLGLKGESNNEVNIPQASIDLQKMVKEHIEDLTGAKVNDIRVEIINVTPPINRSK